MKAVDKFRQERVSFILLSAYSTLSFLAVCILFGLYIYCSFNSVSTITQGIEGNNNSQEINK